MIQIQLSNVSLTLAARPIFRQLNWEIQHDQKIGLIGPNGAGKSSLFKLIMHEFHPEPGGTITRAKGVTVGYLAQQPGLDENLSGYEAVLAGNPRVGLIREELFQLELRLADPDVYGNEKQLTRVLEKQQTLLEEYQALGGDQFEKKVIDLLTNLGLPQVDINKPVRQLSGGQKKLVGLASLLLLSPDVLLLDEPDNHLDLAAKQFLERFIREYKGSVVIISHDRYLLDAAVTHIAELEDGRLTTFAGDYSSYMFDKEQRLARQDELFHVQQRQIHRIEAAIKRYAIWAKTYDSEKFAKRARSIQHRLDKVERIDKPVLERRRMNLRLHGWRGSEKVLELEKVAKSFGYQTILQPANLILRHGERVGVIGRNGTGKSVLLKLALGILHPDEGDVILGPSITTGYYAQEHDTLTLEQTVLDCVRMAGNLSESRAVSFLQHYLFNYRQASQKVKELSGGERSRLQLALLVLSGANFLLLDEPTNNLDIASAEVLEESLEEFEGTVLVISHDRYFLDQVVDRILVLEDGNLLEFPGNYTDYLMRTQG
jgi:ATP-binding cassette subfamily F protein 3